MMRKSAAVMFVSKAHVGVAVPVSQDNNSILENLDISYNEGSWPGIMGKAMLGQPRGYQWETRCQ